MRTITAALLMGAAVASLPAAEKDTRCYEMRTYYAAPGKLDALHARFRDHTLKLLKRHGIESLGYWMAPPTPENKLVFILVSPSREAREKSWKAFMADPDWQAAYKASEREGRLVTNVVSVFLTATDYSPAIQPTTASPPRVFELRTYTAAPGRLDALHARFRDHTLKLFARHGMTSFGYWVPAPGQKGAEDTLIYLLAHKSQEAAAESFKAFRADPEWIAAKAASEQKAGGSLTAPDGVKSVFLTPTDYSPTK
jgi:hypothetical protein